MWQLAQQNQPCQHHDTWHNYTEHTPKSSRAPSRNP
uniref:Uncharacterized protein n=1 Tax=Rhizophora mucronata TaxID=61149 RepID=A0A2P2NZC0_RHIMU